MIWIAKNIDSEPTTGSFLIFGFHIQPCLEDGLDNCIQRDMVTAVSPRKTDLPANETGNRISTGVVLYFFCVRWLDAIENLPCISNVFVFFIVNKCNICLNILWF